MEPRVYTAAEPEQRWRAEKAERLKTLTWGGWKLDPEALTLTHEEGYEVDLEDMTDSASMLDWVFQVNGKNWATPQVQADFLDALDEILKPQENFCSGESDHTTDPKAAVQQFLASAI